MWLVKCPVVPMKLTDDPDFCFTFMYCIRRSSLSRRSIVCDIDDSPFLCCVYWRLFCFRVIFLSVLLSRDALHTQFFDPIISFCSVFVCRVALLTNG